jgi:predicted DNA binding CopG/RHH family protein
VPRSKRARKFRSEAAERRYWETHDSAGAVDYARAKVVRFAKLKPTTETISLRLPISQLARLKTLAHKRDVPYQTLLKVLLEERLGQELRPPRG